METCRLCMVRSIDAQFRPIIGHEGGEGLVAMIFDCTSVSVTTDDGLPKTICMSCLDQASQHDSQNVGTVKQLETNDSSETDLLDGNYKCDICCKVFETCFDYLDHQSSHNGSAVFECSQCHEVFDNKSDLVKHDEKHATPCPVCGKVMQKNCLKLHLVKHTDRNKCAECSKTFCSPASLFDHTITMHTDIRDHVCEVCSKGFSSKGSLNVHKRIHSEERKYRCQKCPYSGRTASALYVHNGVHLKESHVCQDCSKSYKNARYLALHIRRVHMVDKKHRCPYCPKYFGQKYLLRNHMRCHEDAESKAVDETNPSFDQNV